MNQSRFWILACIGLIGISSLNAQTNSPTQTPLGARPVLAPPPIMNPAMTPATVDAILAWDSQTKETTVTNGTPEAHFTFNLTNISTGDIIIKDVHTSCGCTVAQLPEQPWTITPGKSGEISVTMNLAGKMGTVPKTVTVNTDKGAKMLLVKSIILPAASIPEMSGPDRENNQKMALTDRQAVFRGECAKCHVEPAQGKMGQALYASACGVCHEAEHRASMVPNLHAIPQETNAEFWRNWIANGKPGTLMPAFAQSQGGILTDEQIASLVNYLSATIPSRPAAPLHAAIPK